MPMTLPRYWKLIRTTPQTKSHAPVFTGKVESVQRWSSWRMMLPMRLLQVPQIIQQRTDNPKMALPGMGPLRHLCQDNGTLRLQLSWDGLRETTWLVTWYSQIGTSTFSTTRLTSTQRIPSSTPCGQRRLSSIHFRSPFLVLHRRLQLRPLFPLRHYPIRPTRLL